MGEMLSKKSRVYGYPYVFLLLCTSVRTTLKATLVPCSPLLRLASEADDPRLPGRQRG